MTGRYVRANKWRLVQSGGEIRNRGPRLDALLKRAVASNEIWRVCRGLYCLSNRYAQAQVSPLVLAQRIHGPSYISLETALSHHGWIPEAVRTITSTTVKRSRTFNTPVGFFSFTRIPQRSFFSGVRRVSGDGDAFFLATPLKALADYVYAHRCDWSSSTPVIESLRVDKASLCGLTQDMFDEVMAAYRPGRVSRFLVALRKDLQQ